MTTKKRNTVLLVSLGLFGIVVLLTAGCGSEAPPIQGSNAMAGGTLPKAGSPSKPKAKCQPPVSAEDTKIPTPGGASSGSNAGNSTWSQLPPQNKRLLMEMRVLPEMQKLFKGFDGKRYSHADALHCNTCHGEKDKSKEIDFQSPSKLYPLDPNNMPTENDPDPYIARSVKFMKEKVTPIMRALIQSQNIDCFSCHARKTGATTPKNPCP